MQNPRKNVQKIHVHVNRPRNKADGPHNKSKGAVKFNKSTGSTSNFSAVKPQGIIIGGRIMQKAAGGASPKLTPSPKPRVKRVRVESSLAIQQDCFKKVLVEVEGSQKTNKESGKTVHNGEQEVGSSDEQGGAV